MSKGDAKLTSKFSRRSVTSKPGEPPQAPLLRLDFSQDSADAKAWLCGHGIPPLPLGLGEITLGRHSQCNVVLPHVSVSRRHAILSSRGKDLLLEDNGSQNGCMVNGARVVARKVLRPGDRILIGPYLFEVREEAPARGTSARMPALAGSLEDRALLEVIQSIDFRKKTCTLEIKSGDKQGFLTTREGKPLQAAWGSVLNEEALFAMLELNAGQFALISDAPHVKSTFQLPLRTILFTALKRMDEDFDSMDTQKF